MARLDRSRTSTTTLAAGTAVGARSLQVIRQKSEDGRVLRKSRTVTGLPMFGSLCTRAKDLTGRSHLAVTYEGRHAFNAATIFSPSGANCASRFALVWAFVNASCACFLTCSARGPSPAAEI